MRSEFIVQTAALVPTAGAWWAIPKAVAGLIDANIYWGIAVVLTCAVLAASIYVLWQAFNIGDDRPSRERPHLEMQAAAALEQSARLTPIISSR